MAIRLRVDFPGVAKGTELTLVGTVYTAGALSFAPRHVAENPEQIEDVQTLIAGASTYFYIDDTGVIRSATWTNTLTDRARRTYRNVYFSNALATAVRNRIVVALDEARKGWDY